MKTTQLFASVLSLALLVGCADAPTAALEAREATPRFTHGHYVYLSGPDSIDTNGSYTFYAATHALVEPTFTWYQRYCPTSDVASCTAVWGYVTSNTYYTPYDGKITRSLSVDCSGDGQKSYQLQVRAKGWVAPEVSDIHVTRLCTPEPL
jgi:hypothetical protein